VSSLEGILEWAIGLFLNCSKRLILDPKQCSVLRNRNDGIYWEQLQGAPLYHIISTTLIDHVIEIIEDTQAHILFTTILYLTTYNLTSQVDHTQEFELLTLYNSIYISLKQLKCTILTLNKQQQYRDEPGQTVQTLKH